jgi:ketosteroid isomerase-like protein
MQKMRYAVLAFGLVLLIVGGIGVWRATHPPLTAEEQIVANIDDAAAGIEQRSVSRLAHYLAPEFSWNGTPRADVTRALAGTFYQWRDVQLQRTVDRVQVSGDTATTSGTYRISFRPAPDAAPETQAGTYTLQWRLRDGNWQIVAAQGGEALRGE